MAKQITADQINGLLAARHRDDLFVAECKNGQSWGDGMLRMDAWVMKRSWSPWTTIGYEIKVSRQDFERDQKWIGYLDYTHQFYFCCPAGLIKSHELPKGVGLVWTTMAGDKLQTKVKAAHNRPDPEKLLKLMSYVLMSRSVIVANMYDANQRKEPGLVDRVERVREMVEAAGRRQELAYMVRGHIRDQFEGMRKQANAAKLQGARVDRFVEQLTKLGIIWDPKAQGWADDQRVRDEINVLRSTLGPYELENMRGLAEKMLRTVKEIESLREVKDVR